MLLAGVGDLDFRVACGMGDVLDAKAAGAVFFSVAAGESIEPPDGLR